MTGFAAPLPDRLLAAAGIGHPGIRVRLRDAIEIDLDVAAEYGLPVAEVARQVDSAVRHTLRPAMNRDVGRPAVHADGLRFQGDADAAPSGGQTGRPAPSGQRGEAG